MKINFSAPITDLDGKPVELAAAELKDGAEIKPAELLTLKVAALNALMATLPGEQNLPGDKKAERFALAMRVNAGGDVDVSPEEVAMMKDLIGKVYSALVVGRAYEILNG